MSLQPRTKALAVVSLAFFTDTLLATVLVPLTPDYAARFGLDQMHVGWLLGSYSLALFLGTFPMARWADRSGRRTPMLAGLAGLALGTVLFACANNYGALVLARIFQGLAAAATWTSGLSLLADEFPPEARGGAMATAFAFANAGALAGPAAGGFLAQHVHPAAPFALVGALAVLDALGRAFWLEDPAEAAPPPASPWAFLRHRAILAFSLAMLFSSSLWAALEALLPLQTAGRFHWPKATIGLVFSSAVATHTLASPLVGRLADRRSKPRLIALGFLASALLLPLTAWAPSGPWLLAVLLALGVAASFAMAPIGPALADAADASGLSGYGSAFSLLNLAYAAGMIVGPVLGSALAQRFGNLAALGAFGLAFLGMALLMTRRDLQAGS